MKLFFKIICAILLLVTCSCEDLFEFSPYDTPVKSKDLNEVNSALISKSTITNDTLKFVLLSDSHDSYDELSDAVASINNLNSIQFVICCGDVTNTGLAQEYNWYVDIVGRLKYPLITTVGNHDHLSNGLKLYRRLFGPENMSFVFDKYKFIVFNDVVWENNNTTPDFEWLQNELSNDSLHNIIIAHIPFWTDQLNGSRDEIEQIVSRENTTVALYGHEHVFSEKYYNGVHSIVSGCIQDREYYILSLVDDSTHTERISF
jgi:3',5'-cyclic-AMP phosphodiesterase